MAEDPASPLSAPAPATAPAASYGRASGRLIVWAGHGWAVWQRAADHGAGTASAAIAFFAILGLVPALSAIGLICGWLSSPFDVLEAFAELCRFLPLQTQRLILVQLAKALDSGSRDGAVALASTLVLGLYGLMNAAQALVDGLNRAYHLTEHRAWLHRTAIASAIALVGALAVVVMIAMLLLAGRFGARLVALHGAVVWLALPAGLMLAVAVLTLVYRFAPARERSQPHRVLPGAIAAVALGLAGSAGFALYAAHLANFTATYGILASVAPVLVWLQLCGYVLLLGASVNGEFPLKP